MPLHVAIVRVPPEPRKSLPYNGPNGREAKPKRPVARHLDEMLELIETAESVRQPRL
jgi:hypothetical protein